MGNPRIIWRKSMACGGGVLWMGLRMRKGHFFWVASVSRDAGGWYVWLPAEKRSGGIFPTLRAAKASL